MRHQMSLSICLALALCSYPSAVSAKVIFVNKNAAGEVHDGTTWVTAFTTVQAGVTATVSGDEVWVAVSAPAAPAYVENVKVKSGVSVGLYGGFAGTETERSQRDFRANATVLDGNYAGVVVYAPLSNSTAVVDGFIVRNGYGSSMAGGILVSGAASVPAVIANNVITAIDGAGIMINGIGSAVILNNTITGNTSSSCPGIWVRGTATITNNTLTANTGTSCILVSGTATVANTLVAFNDAGIVKEAAGTLTLKNNDIYGNSVSDYSGVTDPTGTNGNIKTDPLLSSIYRDVHLQPGSPCIGAGDNSAVTAGSRDIDGQARIQGAGVDIGSDESDGTIWPPAHVIRHVTLTGNDGADGLTWATAKRSVTLTMASAQAGDSVWVARGVYMERVAVPFGVSLYGGFAGTETEQSQRDWTANVSVLDGNRGGTVVTTDRYGIVDGFTIRNGKAMWASGGGILVKSGSAVIAHNTFFANRADQYGGGVCSYGGWVCISGNIFNDNTADQHGGGIYANGAATIANNVFFFNEADDLGGAIAIGTSGSAAISGNTLFSNFSDTNGGGIGISGTATITNNTLTSNISGGGGGIRVDGAATIVSNVLTGNSAPGTGGGGINVAGSAGIYNNTLTSNTSHPDGAIWVGGTVSASNNILAFNDSAVYLFSGTVTLKHNNAFGNTVRNYFGSGMTDPTGTDGNIKADPLFVNRTAGDYRLAYGSPCIDAGDDAAVTPDGLDLDGKPRIQGGHVDIGAYEYAQFTIGDAVRCLAIAGGLTKSLVADTTRLDMEGSFGSIDLNDALQIVRKAVGLETHP